MTTIIIKKSSNGEYREFNCIGHAGHGFFFQKDVVCAALSVLVINTINSLEEISHEEIKVVTNKKEGLIYCSFENDILKEQSKLLMDSMVLGITEIAKQYGEKYVKLTFEEV